MKEARAHGDFSIPKRLVDSNIESVRFFRLEIWVAQSRRRGGKTVEEIGRFKGRAVTSTQFCLRRREKIGACETIGEGTPGIFVVIVSATCGQRQIRDNFPLILQVKREIILLVQGKGIIVTGLQIVGRARNDDI